MKTGVFAFILAAVMLVAALAQEPNVDRRILVRQDLAIAGYEVVLIEGTIPIGGREGLHSHPGTLVGYVMDGEITLTHEDREPVAYGAGDSFEVEPDKIHEGINTGGSPVTVIATFVVPKDKPMTTQVD